MGQSPLENVLLVATWLYGLLRTPSTHSLYNELVTETYCVTMWERNHHTKKQQHRQSMAVSLHPQTKAPNSKVVLEIPGISMNICFLLTYQRLPELKRQSKSVMDGELPRGCGGKVRGGRSCHFVGASSDCKLPGHSATFLKWCNQHCNQHAEYAGYVSSQVFGIVLKSLEHDWIDRLTALAGLLVDLSQMIQVLCRLCDRIVDCNLLPDLCI